MPEGADKPTPDSFGRRLRRLRTTGGKDRSGAAQPPPAGDAAADVSRTSPDAPPNVGSNAAGGASPTAPNPGAASPESFSRRLRRLRGDAKRDAAAAMKSAPQVQSKPPVPDSFVRRLGQLSHGEEPVAGSDGAPMDLDKDSSVTAVPEAAPVGGGEHQVRSGECIASIACETGHFWKTIWEDGANAELRTARKEDSNVLLPGDRVHIPPLQPRGEPCAAERRHRFVRRGEPFFLPVRLRLLGEPLANVPYRIEVDGRLVDQGTTDAEGKVRAPIRGDARAGILIAQFDEQELEFELGLGEVDPIDAPTGQWQRLWNLGFLCEQLGLGGQRTESEFDARRLAVALSDFQRSEELEASGRPDQATLDRLRERHGS